METRKTKAGYACGWLNSSIKDLVPFLPASSDSTAFALITCLDSSLSPASLLEENRKLREMRAKAVGSGLLVPIRTLQQHGDQLFFGFDEVWFFPHDEVEPKPESAWIVGPHRVNEAKLDNLGSWLSSNSCSLGLGDGAGLNFIVKAHGLIRYLLAHSLAQPEMAQHVWVQD